jgi:hypothetical protein
MPLEPGATEAERERHESGCRARQLSQGVEQDDQQQQLQEQQHADSQVKPYDNKKNAGMPAWL